MQETIDTIAGAGDEPPTEGIPAETSQDNEITEVAPSEPKRNESGKETAERALRDIKASQEKRGDDDTADAAKETKEQTTKDAAQQVKGKDKSDDFDPDLSPPQRFTAQAQKLFNNLPVGLKREVNKTVRSLEALTTKERNEYTQATQHVRGIIDAVQPFAVKWGERGFTVPAAIASLAATQEKLTNPETKLETYINLGRDLGIPLEQMNELLEGGQAAPKKVENNPLQQRLESLELQIEQDRIRQQSQPIVNEMQAVQHEVDPASGKYRYPELHDDIYLDSLKSRISQLAGIAIEQGQRPNYAEALKQANAERKAQLFGASQQQSANRLQPASANQQIAQRAVQAAVTVRGKTQPISSGGLNGLEIPPEARKDARATARWIEQQLRGRSA